LRLGVIFLEEQTVLRRFPRYLTYRVSPRILSFIKNDFLSAQRCS